jgi:hypothetical protein
MAHPVCPGRSFRFGEEITMHGRAQCLGFANSVEKLFAEEWVVAVWC